MCFEGRLRSTIQFVGGLLTKVVRKYVCGASAARKAFWPHGTTQIALWRSEIACHTDRRM